MKKTLLFLIVMLSFIVKAQTINFSDLNFKNKLFAYGVAKNSSGNTMIVDTNNDGEVQVSEAMNVFELDLWSTPINTINDIVDINGIQYFQNLKKLNCIGNSLTSLNLVGLNNLEYLMAGSNHISSISITGLVSLKEIKIAENLLTSINIDNLINLTTLFIYDNQLSSLNLNNNTSLENLWCSNNSIPTLDLSTTPSLKNIVCDNNLLTSINLGSINLINELICSNNNLTNLNISNLSQMTYFDFANNQIPTINFPNTNSISSLNISGNPISAINLNALSVLNQFTVSNTLLTNLDCSQTGVMQLFCSNNPNLQSINVQNNVFTYSDPDLLYFGFTIVNNPQLVSICVDNGEQNNLPYTNYNATGNVVIYTGTTCSTVVIPDTSSNTDFKTNNFTLYPNPARNNLTIINNDNVEIKTISIYNTIGQLIKSTTNLDGTIDVSDLKSGTYFISIELKKGIATEKFIKI